MTETPGFLWDCPAPCWDGDLLSGKHLHKEGRTTAQQYVDKSAFVFYETGTGDRYYGMRRSLYHYAEESEEPELLSDDRLLGDMCEDKLRILVNLFVCQSKADADFLLQHRLGARGSVKELLSCCSRYTVVVVGPKARQLWKRSPESPVPWQAVSSSKMRRFVKQKLLRRVVPKNCCQI